jgi:sporulation protein YlmC with PRC-barrel domain
MLVSGQRAPLAQGVQLVVVDLKAVAAGYRTSKLRGESVQNDKNDKIGTLDDIIIGADKDRVLFAILQVGGFLGLGGHLVAVPFRSLQIDDTGAKITLPGASKEELKQLPEFHYAG